MTRRELLGGAGVFACLSHAEAQRPSLLLLGVEEAARMRTFLPKDASRAQTFRQLADKALRAGPWSVTNQRPSGVQANAGPNDYYSEGPYWWPDPKNPSGPYIRKDGERNPNRFQDNRRDLGDMCEAVLSLGIGSYFLGEARYAERASRVLGVWFVNPKTRMNPNLEFGQAVRGHNVGRGTGIIDTVSLIHCATGAMLANASGKLDASALAGVRQWYAEYLKWMTTSAKGLDEKKASNNHATWWTAQAAAFASFTGNSAERRMCWDHYRAWLVPGQVLPDGSCPREEARTRSLSYSAMNLDGFSVICRLAQLDGENLWNFRTPKGIGIEKSFHYLMPFALDPSKWKKPQIGPFEQDRCVFPALAGLGLKSPELLSAYRKLPRAAIPWVQLVDLLAASPT